MLGRVAAFCRPLRPVLLLVSFPRSRSPVVGVPGLCWMWRDVPFARQRRPVVGVLGLCWLLPASFDCFCCPHTSVHKPLSSAPPPQLCSLPTTEQKGIYLDSPTFPAPEPTMVSNHAPAVGNQQPKRTALSPRLTVPTGAPKGRQSDPDTSPQPSSPPEGGCPSRTNGNAANPIHSPAAPHTRRGFPYVPSISMLPSCAGCPLLRQNKEVQRERSRAAPCSTFARRALQRPSLTPRHLTGISVDGATDWNRAHCKFWD